MPTSPSDIYLIANLDGQNQYVYCHLEECGSDEGWTRVAYLDMTVELELITVLAEIHVYFYSSLSYIYTVHCNRQINEKVHIHGTERCTNVTLFSRKSL